MSTWTQLALVVAFAAALVITFVVGRRLGNRPKAPIDKALRTKRFRKSAERPPTADEPAVDGGKPERFHLTGTIALAETAEAEALPPGVSADHITGEPDESDASELTASEPGTGQADQPILLGTDDGAVLSMSDGVAFVNRLSASSVRLGGIPVGTAGVPVTRANCRLEVGGEVIDLFGYVVAQPRGRLDASWELLDRDWCVSLRQTCIAMALGPADEADQLSECFAGAGSRSGVWALEAAPNDDNDPAVVAGLSVIDGAIHIVASARGAHDLRAEWEDGISKVRHQIAPELDHSGIVTVVQDVGPSGGRLAAVLVDANSSPILKVRIRARPL